MAAKFDLPQTAYRSLYKLLQNDGLTPFMQLLITWMNLNQDQLLPKYHEFLLGGLYVVSLLRNVNFW